MTGEESLTPRERAERKRKLAEIFGDVLPEQTSDDAESADADTEEKKDAWLKRQVPPHHG